MQSLLSYDTDFKNNLTKCIVTKLSSARTLITLHANQSNFFLIERKPIKLVSNTDFITQTIAMLLQVLWFAFSVLIEFLGELNRNLANLLALQVFWWWSTWKKFIINQRITYKKVNTLLDSDVYVKWLYLFNAKAPQKS